MVTLRTEVAVFFEGHRHETIRILCLLEDLLGMPRSVPNVGYTPLPQLLLSPEQRRLGEQQRRVLISALCLTDEMLGLPRTVPSREERRGGPVNYQDMNES
ncbi:MAG: hypothetical protein KJ077_10545 [Anaerolineae bacterium]|nr:hypothetical protein [Anaerolineae bacterium]